MRHLGQLGKALLLASAITTGCASADNRRQDTLHSSIQGGPQPDGSYIYCSPFSDPYAAKEHAISSARGRLMSEFCNPTHKPGTYDYVASDIPSKEMHRGDGRICARAYRTSETRIDCKSGDTKPQITYPFRTDFDTEPE
jgi:hypothetical protein